MEKFIQDFKYEILEDFIEKKYPQVELIEKTEVDLLSIFEEVYYLVRENYPNLPQWKSITKKDWDFKPYLNPQSNHWQKYLLPRCHRHKKSHSSIFHPAALKLRQFPLQNLHLCGRWD